MYQKINAGIKQLYFFVLTVGGLSVESFISCYHFNEVIFLSYIPHLCSAHFHSNQSVFVFVFLFF